MLELKAQGVAQIIISHRLVDIFAVGDRVMVLKRGENVGDRYIRHTSEQEILELIVAGTRETALTADEAIGKGERSIARERGTTGVPVASSLGEQGGSAVLCGIPTRAPGDRAL